MRTASVWVILFFLCTACGSFPFVTKKNKKRPKARLSMQSDQMNAPRAFKLFDSRTCKTDPATGLTKVEFGSGGNSLKIELRGDLTPDEYECKQASNNYQSSQHIGDGYDTCMVQVQVDAPHAEGKYNAYEIFRSSPETGLFRYGDRCRVRVDEAGQSLKGSILCENMAQTTYRSLARNPVSLDNERPEETASFSGDFGCRLERGQLKTDFPADPPPPASLGSTKIQWTDADEQKSQTLKFNDAEACDFNPATGLLTVSLTNAESARLGFAIRDFLRQPGTYSCEQALNNQDRVSEVGDLYDTCMVALSFTSDDPGDGDVGFAMHRASTEIKRFTYASSCTIGINDIENGLMQGEIDCQQMAQTIYAGYPRNPVAEDDVTADVVGDLASSFACRIHTVGEEQ